MEIADSEGCRAKNDRLILNDCFRRTAIAATSSDRGGILKNGNVEIQHLTLNIREPSQVARVCGEERARMRDGYR
jgi:hypothetical protein